MNANNLRLLWGTVAKLSPDTVTETSYEVLMQGLLHQLTEQISLSADEQIELHSYLNRKESLVRDLLYEH